jgi:hypothetical protein
MPRKQAFGPGCRHSWNAQAKIYDAIATAVVG